MWGNGGRPLGRSAADWYGLKQLSMSAYKLPRIKAVIRHLNTVECRRLLDQVMELSDEQETRDILRAYLIESGAERFL